MNDIPSVASQRRWAEGVVIEADQETSSTPIVFTVSPYTISYRDNDEGWVDARAHSQLNIIVTSISQNCSFVVETKRTSNDPSPATLVTSTAVSSGSTAQLYAGVLDYIAYFRVLQTGLAGGKINASFLMK